MMTWFLLLVAFLIKFNNVGHDGWKMMIRQTRTHATLQAMHHHRQRRPDDDVGTDCMWEEEDVCMIGWKGEREGVKEGSLKPNAMR